MQQVLSGVVVVFDIDKNNWNLSRMRAAIVAITPTTPFHHRHRPGITFSVWPINCSWPILTHKRLLLLHHHRHQQHQQLQLHWNLGKFVIVIAMWQPFGTILKDCAAFMKIDIIMIRYEIILSCTSWLWGTRHPFMDEYDPCNYCRWYNNNNDNNSQSTTSKSPFFNYLVLGVMPRGNMRIGMMWYNITWLHYVRTISCWMPDCGRIIFIMPIWFMP